MYESRYNTATLWTKEVMGCSNLLSGPSEAKGQSMPYLFYQDYFCSAIQREIKRSQSKSTQYAIKK